MCSDGLDEQKNMDKNGHFKWSLQKQKTCSAPLASHSTLFSMIFKVFFQDKRKTSGPSLGLQHRVTKDFNSSGIKSMHFLTGQININHCGNVASQITK